MFLNDNNTAAPGLNLWVDSHCEVFLIYPARRSHFKQCTLCGKSNAPQVFQVTWVNYHCVSYPPVYSCSPCPCALTLEGGGSDAAVAVSWHVTFLWRSLQMLLVPVWEIRHRHEEAGWGETWSRPQIAPTTEVTYDGGLLESFRQLLLSLKVILSHWAGCQEREI